MKFGYIVTGKDQYGEFTSGKCDTKAQIVKTYKFMMAAKQYTDETKKSLKICELRAIDMTNELIGE
jgi:hypothetical protein